MELSRTDGQALLILTNLPDEAGARDLATMLVSRRLAACVNVIPGVTSYYRWKGQLQRDAELLLVIKTRAACLDGLRATLARLHPYDVPELVALKVEDGLAPYLAWLDESTGGGKA